MRSIICLIIFHTVFGKHYLVELEKKPKENELNYDEYITFEDFSSEDEEMTKTEEGNDYARNHAPRPHAHYARGTHAPYARASTDENCGGDNSLIILH